MSAEVVVAENELIEVVAIDLAESYEWEEFHAWYSPARRVYFWASGSGCSCNAFGDDIRSLDDLQNGRERSDVMAAVNAFFDESYRDAPSDRVDALYRVNTFQPPKAGGTS